MAAKRVFMKVLAAVVVLGVVAFVIGSWATRPARIDFDAQNVAGVGPEEGVRSDLLPPPESAEFCVAVQQRLASTELRGVNTLFTDMPSYRHSKPLVQPFTIYQVVTYDGSLPIMVSCKLKTAAHLRAEFGNEAAGRQLFCPDITREIRQQAVDEFNRANMSGAADNAKALVIDNNEPYMAGGSYLADFLLSYRAPDGSVHLNSPGLFQNYDSWITPVLPKIFQGQSYCHLPTVEYLKALATDAIDPGTVVTTADDAPVTPETL